MDVCGDPLLCPTRLCHSDNVHARDIQKLTALTWSPSRLHDAMSDVLADILFNGKESLHIIYMGTLSYEIITLYSPKARLMIWKEKNYT